jgi:DNA-binding IclR family transcriptional regulator
MSAAAADGTRSQTLHRGLVLLELLGDAPGPMSLPELTRATGWHRSIVYRLLRTLADHRLLTRTGDERYALGLGLLALTRGLATDLRSAAAPELAALADELGMTAFLVVRDGEEAVTLLSVEPTASPAHVAYRPGNRHPVTLGAPGLALLMPLPPAAADRPELVAARARGWATSTGEVLPGLSSVAAPLAAQPAQPAPPAASPAGVAAGVAGPFAASPAAQPAGVAAPLAGVAAPLAGVAGPLAAQPAGVAAAVAVVFAGGGDPEVTGRRVRDAARRIADRLP